MKSTLVLSIIAAIVAYCAATVFTYQLPSNVSFSSVKSISVANPFGLVSVSSLNAPVTDASGNNGFQVKVLCKM